MPDLARSDRLSADLGSDIPGQLASWPSDRIRSISSFARSDREEPLELPQSLGMVSPTAVSDPVMMDESEKSARQAKTSRDERLKSALRENLKRRKLQARERTAGAEPSPNDDGSLNEGAAGKAGT